MRLHLGPSPWMRDPWRPGLVVRVVPRWLFRVEWTRWLLVPLIRGGLGHLAAWLGTRAESRPDALGLSLRGP